MKKYKHILIFVFLIVLMASFLFTVDISDVAALYIQQNYFLGSLLYIFLLIISIVIAPFTMPLFFVAGGIFGALAASIYNIIGWGVGAVVAFSVARFFKEPLLKHFISFNKIRVHEKKIPQDFEFLGVVLLRMVLPVDVLSYALGLFSSITFTRYILATIIGITPFAFAFAYGGSALIDGKYLMFLTLAAVALIALGIGFYILRDRG